MNTEQLIESLETNPELDTFFIPQSEDPENMEVFLKVGSKYYYWSELTDLQEVKFKPVNKISFN